MKKKKTLWSGATVLIIALVLIAVFTREYVQLGLSVVAVIAWSVWAILRFSIPFVRARLNAAEARKIRKYYEAREREEIASNKTSDTPDTFIKHVNHRITSYLKSAYPDATWEWCIDDPMALVVNGGTGRIRVFGANDFSHADVTVNKNAEISYQMLKIVPMANTVTDAEAAEDVKNTIPDSPNPQVWYEHKGRVVLENLIADLNSRGHSSLTITESGEVIIEQEDRKIKKAMLEAMPDKRQWDRLSKVLQGEGYAADINDTEIVVSWC